MHHHLKAAIAECKASLDSGIQHEIGSLQSALSALERTEKAVKVAKVALSAAQDLLALKLELKRIGPDGFPGTMQHRLMLASQRLVQITTTKSSGQKSEYRSKELAETKKQMAYISRMQGCFAALPKEHDISASLGIITDAEAKELILEKHHDLVADQLTRYLNAEKRALLSVFETLWDKYAVSTAMLEGERAASMTELQGYLYRLGYGA